MRVFRLFERDRGRRLRRAVPGSRTVLLVLPLVLAVPASCDRDPEGPELATETYIDVMVALRRAQTYETTPAEFAARRAEILREAGVTDSVLVQWARAHGGDVTLLAAVWDSINARLMAVEDSAR